MSTSTRNERPPDSAAKPRNGRRAAGANGGGAKPSQSSTRTLGPISDLERHLPSDWWQTLFTSLYLKTDGDVVENDQATAREVDLVIRAAGLEPNDRILDLCCGQGRHCLEFARRGYSHVEGIDRSRYLVRLARRRAKHEHLPLAFREGDARKIRTGENLFHCVTILGNSFGYFERVEDDVAVLEAVKRVLVGGGTLVLDITDGEWMREHFERRSWEWIDQNHIVCRERGLACDSQRLVSREVVIHAERGVITDQFYAERLYSRAQLVELLEQVGFEKVRFHGELTGQSTREQDLGMMAHRMFLTAQNPYKPVTLRKRGPAFPRVTVLMGDPSLPDSVKLDGKFNSEDFETIRRLKEALAELPGYQFNFMSNHASLLTDLRSSPPEFVFNLCDEGYNNDAFMELHVPAVLEMLNIPYSGAGPTALGLCYDKAVVRSIAAGLDISVPLETYFNPDDTSATLPSVFPALVKPCHGDSSIGITKDAVVHDPDELMAYLAQLRHILPGRPVLIEEFLPGREYSVGIVGNPGLTWRTLPVLEVDYSNLPAGLPRILGYESKWMPDSPYWTTINYQRAILDEDTRVKLLDWSAALFERTGCRDYARFDWRTGADGEVKLLEVNPNPGWCWDGKFNLMAGFAGMRYADLLAGVIEAAQERVSATRTVMATA